jgi:rubredoxin
MANFVLRCPQTGFNVQHRWPDEEKPDDDEVYQAVACPACTRMHLINRSTGKPLATFCTNLPRCRTCGYTYNEESGDPNEGLAPGTRWADIPEDWVCPLCGTPKSDFDMIEL